VQADLLRMTAQQVAQVCDTLEQAGDTPRLARFLWSLPTDVRSTTAFDQFEPVLKARAVIAYHGGEFHQLYRILTTYRFVAVTHNTGYRVNDIALLNKSSQSYGLSLAIMGSRSITFHQTQVNTPPP